MSNTTNHNQAVASLVLGIIAIASCFFGLGAFVGVVCGIIGIVMANKAKSAGNTEGVCKAGFVCSIVGTAVSGVVLVVALMAFGTLATLAAY